MPKRKTEYVTARDIVIPAGTKVYVDPPKRTAHGYDAASILTAESDDCTSEWRMPLDEAIEVGLVKPLA